MNAREIIEAAFVAHDLFVIQPDESAGLSSATTARLRNAIVLPLDQTLEITSAVLCAPPEFRFVEMPRAVTVRRNGHEEICAFQWEFTELARIFEVLYHG